LNRHCRPFWDKLLSKNNQIGQLILYFLCVFEITLWIKVSAYFVFEYLKKVNKSNQGKWVARMSTESAILFLACKIFDAFFGIQLPAICERRTAETSYEIFLWNRFFRDWQIFCAFKAFARKMRAKTRWWNWPLEPILPNFVFLHFPFLVGKLACTFVKCRKRSLIVKWPSLIAKIRKQRKKVL